jgi:hypothetical protein
MPQSWTLYDISKTANRNRRFGSTHNLRFFTYFVNCFAQPQPQKAKLANTQLKINNSTSAIGNHSLINGFDAAVSTPAKSKLETLPNTYVHSGTTFSHQRIAQLKQKKAKSERLKLRYKTRDTIIGLLNEVGETKTADSMELCGAKFSVLTCGDHIASKTPFHRCNVRYCPMCANRRSSKYQNKYLPYASAFVKDSPVKLTPCLLTLTQKKITGERLKDSRERVLASFRKFIRHSFFAEYFAGGVFTIENTVSDNANHTHIHCVVFRKKFIDHKLLKNQWSLVSPNAENLNIKLIDSLESGLRECIKYVSKPIDAARFERQHLLELLEIKGKRMIDSFGEFRKFCRDYELPETETTEREKLVEGSCCPKCNDKNNLLFAITLTSAQLIDFYRQKELSARGSP